MPLNKNFKMISNILLTDATMTKNRKDKLRTILAVRDKDFLKEIVYLKF